MNDRPRVGVYICHCGSNIAGTVDVADVARWAEKLPYVEVSRDYKFMCSSLGQELIEKDIKEREVNRVVVASCSPHLHEPTFRNACSRAGLNPYLFEMSNIREQDSWVTEDKLEATKKAKALVAAAVNRVIFQEPLESLFVPIDPNVLIVGGGITGIQAALEIADSGKHVYIVEREPSLGGHMAQFDKTFPTLDCSACILTPKMFSAGNHKNITMFTWSEVEKVEGFIGNFTVTIRKKARFIDESLCTGCGLCQEKCPKKVIDDVFEAGIGYRKAVYTPFPQAVPKYPVIDHENCTYFIKGTCKACEKFCPTGAIDFNQEDTLVTLKVGNIILATGYDLFDARKIPQYGYGRLPNVFTSLEFERLTNAAGPTGGKVYLRDGVTVPKSVAIVHCVGSRDKHYNNYCSAICCMQSLKFAHLVKEKTGAEVYEFYIDMRTPAKSYDEFYLRILKEGTHFIRGRVAEVTGTARSENKEGKLIVQAEDTLIGKQRRIPVDMVILSAGLQARADAKEVAIKFGISCSADSWFIEKHPKLDPVATMTDGVMVAGACQGPKDIPASVAQGAAAATRVLSIIGQGEIEIEAATALVNEETCVGCKECIPSCPYTSIEYLADKNKAHVIEALCKGCGTCVGTCLSKSIKLRHYTDDQLVAEMIGAMQAMKLFEAIDLETAAAGQD
ncbi:MAG: CoB--CoM heterodisulfide reductase iron-sulfur subunit A family protein [Chloroflexota bacterium]|nr:MAG: CoB--CoM heterodisulfide reductase iron-sulfur subunit A family protein [Chloroflexota bacterium]